MSLPFYCYTTELCVDLVDSTGHSHSVLSEAVHVYMYTIGEGHHEDVMRAFFRTRASDIYQLLPHVIDIVERATHERGRSLSNALPEANMIVLVRHDIHASVNAVANFDCRQF